MAKTPRAHLNETPNGQSTLPWQTYLKEQATVERGRAREAQKQDQAAKSRRNAAASARDRIAAARKRR